MAIILRLDRVMADRKISLNELAGRVGISNVNLSRIKTGRISAIRFSTLNAICEVLTFWNTAPMKEMNRKARRRIGSSGVLFASRRSRISGFPVRKPTPRWLRSGRPL